MNETTKRVRLTFLEEILGTASGNKELHETYIASKAPDAKTKAQEIEAIGVEEAINRAMTIFPRNAEGKPIFWPYQVKGFFKSAQKAMNAFCEDKKSADYLAGYKGKIDLGLFIKATQDDWGGESTGIEIHIPDVAEMSNCERPLRAETLQGTRAGIANSETCPAGSYIEIDIKCLGDLGKRLDAWLDYGRYNGLGQWRNAGKGRFAWEKIE